MAELSRFWSIPLAFAVVSVLQLLSSEMLRSWGPIKGLGDKLFSAASSAHEVGGIHDFFFGEEGMALTPEASAALERRRSAVLGIADLAATAASLVSNLFISAFVLAASGVLAFFAGAHMAWWITAGVWSAVNLVLFVSLLCRWIFGTLRPVPFGAKPNNWFINQIRQLFAFNTPRPYAVTVILGNLYAIIVSAVAT